MDWTLRAFLLQPLLFQSVKEKLAGFLLQSLQENDSSTGLFQTNLKILRDLVSSLLLLGLIALATLLENGAIPQGGTLVGNVPFGMDRPWLPISSRRGDGVRVGEETVYDSHSQQKSNIVSGE